MYYLISILPIILYLALIKGMDGFSITGWSKLAECFLWGIFSCLLCISIGFAVGPDDIDNYPIPEEIIKALPLIVAVFRRRCVFFVETLTYGATIGAGFAMAENILYVYLSPEFVLGDAVLRGVGTSLVHIGCTAFLANLVLIARRISDGKPVIVAILCTIAGILPSVAIHNLYNYFFLPDYLQMVIVVVFFIPMFIILYSIDERLIHKWLDKCINNDIALYSSIKHGQLHGTNAGKYLMATKEKFSPEVFFDMCVCLDLYLELSIAAKSRLILKEAGMEKALSKEEREEYHNKAREFAELRRSIGVSGMSVLGPLVRAREADKWAIRKMLK